MRTYIQKLIICLVLVVPFALANGEVNLLINGLPSAITSASAGGTFNVQVTLQITANEPVVGVDYYFQELSAAGFFIVSRDLTGSVMPFFNFSDGAVASSGDAAGTDVGPDNALNSRNDRDLGGGAADPNVPPGPGLLANFVLGVGAGVAPGVYTISTTVVTIPSGWGEPSGADHNFDHHASIVITVVPEPATWSLLGLGAVGAIGLNFLRRRNKSRLG